MDVEVQYGDPVLMSMQAEPGERLVSLGSGSGAGVVDIGQNEGYIGTYYIVYTLNCKIVNIHILLSSLTYTNQR